MQPAPRDVSPRARPRRAGWLVLAVAITTGTAHGNPIEPGPPATRAEPKPSGWTLAEALSAPAWLRFGIDTRARFEHLHEDFRASASDATALVARTLITVEARHKPLVLGIELIDARAYATEDTRVNTTIVDPIDLLQARAELRAAELVRPGDAAAAIVGRFTMDVGSRRLVARNKFRNTVNAFTGVDLQWASKAKHELRTFAVMPVRRLPTEAAELADNAIELDRESPNTLLWGMFASAPLRHGAVLELYLIGLAERDGDDLATANRRLITPGFRLHRKKAVGAPDYQLEMIWQRGTSRATTMDTDVTDLRHRASSVHASAGYTARAPWTPRLVIVYDHASGDRDPTDRGNGRFDPLFGARRFDFGPTSLYGAFARSNVVSPGLRTEATPHRRVELAAAYRAFRLASVRDAWTTAGLRDNTGASGAFLGQQLEGSVKWQAIPKNLTLELDAAYYWRGSFAREVSGRTTPTAYLAVGATISI